MNRKVNKLQSVQALRALAVIIVMLLTSATTWALGTKKTVTYIDKSGEAQSVEAVALQGTETSLDEGWYFVDSDVTFSDQIILISAEKPVNLILCDGATLNAPQIDGTSGVFNLCIYGQRQGTGKANITGAISATNSLNVYGGTITAQSIESDQHYVNIYGGTVNAGTITAYDGITISGGTVIASDNITALFYSLDLLGGNVTAEKLISNGSIGKADIVLGGSVVKANFYYAKNGSVRIKDDKTYYDDNGTSYNAGALTADQIQGKTVRPYKYHTGTCGDPTVNEGKDVIWVLGDTDGNDTFETLIISGTGAMASNNTSASWDNQDNITNIVIGNGVTRIGDHAFRECSTLTSVTIPSSVLDIGKHAFEGCTGLTSINIPFSVMHIEGHAFEGCTGLTSINIPSSVKKILYSAFERCTSLTSITIPADVTVIEESAFEGCTSLTDVYCYANPDYLLWTDEYCDDFIKTPAKTTVCHVAGSKLATYESKWSTGSTDVNVTFVGDGIEPNGVAYLVRTVTAGSGTPTDGVKAFLPVDHDLSTGTVTLAEVTGAPKGLPVIYGNATEDEALPDLFFLKYVADDSDADKAIQSDYADKAKAMSKRFVITDGEQTLAEILAGITDVPANEVLFFVLANGKFNTVNVSAADLEKKAKPGLLLFVLSKWEYMHMISSSDDTPVGPIGTRSIGIGSDDGTATGIEAVENIQFSIFNFQSDSWYDLQGRRLSEKPTRKGLYLQNGKKVVVK